MLTHSERFSRAMCLPTQPGSQSRKKRTFCTNKQRMRKTDSVDGAPGGPIGGVCSERKERTTQIGGPLDYGTAAVASFELPSWGRVTLFNEVSTRTSNAAITRGRLAVHSVPPQYHAFFFNPDTTPTHTPKTGHFFNFGCFFFNHDTCPPPTGLKFRLPR